MSEAQVSREKKSRSGLTYAGLGAVLLAGMGLGAFIYSSLSQPARSAAVEPEEHAEEHGAGDGLVVLPEPLQESGNIRIEEAALREMQTVLSVTGVVGPDQTRVAHIRPLARGVVGKVHVRLGDRVKAGDPLVEYDNIELGMLIGEYLSAVAELDRALTDLEVKRTILARSEAMLKVGATARTTHDIRAAEYRDAEARVAAARAVVAKIEEQIHRFGVTDEELAQLRKQDRDAIHRTRSHNILRAPFDGIVTYYDVAEGEVVATTDRLLTITDISTVWVLADVYEQDLGYVSVGKTVTVRVASYPNETFRGRITYISDVIEPSTRTAKVRCVVANPGYRLKLEMFATVDIPTGLRRNVLAVPASAIQLVDDRPVVFVQVSPTEFRKQEIETGAEAGGWVEVLSGLKPGDRVAVQGSFYLKTALLRELIGEEH